MLRNKIKYLLILLVGGFYAILYNERFIGIIYLAAILLPFILLGIVLYTSCKIKISFDTNTFVVDKDEYLNLPIYINNNSIFPISRLYLLIEYQNEFSGEVKKERIQLVLDQKSSQKVSCQITSHYCGSLLFRIKSASLYDYFCIWKVNKKIQQDVRVLVMPEIFEIAKDMITENLSVLTDSDIYSETKPGDDPSEVFSIREYREGDKPNRIHWKLSYKEEELMVKEFSNPLNELIVVLTDLNCGKKNGFRLPLVDGLFDCLISVSIHLLMGEHFHKIMWYDTEEKNIKQIEVKRQEDSLAAVEAMLRTTYEESGTSVLDTIDKCFQNQNFTHFFYITSVLREEEIFEWAQGQKGTIIYLLYVNDISVNPVDEKIKNVMQELKIRFCEIDIRNMKKSIGALGDI